MSSCAASCCASASQRLRPHSPLWFPCQPPARHPPAALLSTTRSSKTIADRTRSRSCPGTEPALALSQMRRPHGGRRETYRCPDPTPFSALSRRSRRMIRPFRSPLSGASDHLPPGCALLAPKPATRFQPRLKRSPHPHTNYHPTNPACALLNSTPSSRSLSHQPNTIQFA
jgi:hypothetical protein